MMGDNLDYSSSHECVDCGVEYPADHDDMQCREDGKWRCFECEQIELGRLGAIKEEAHTILGMLPSWEMR